MSTEAEDLGERIAEMAAHLDAATHRLLTARTSRSRPRSPREWTFLAVARGESSSERVFAYELRPTAKYWLFGCANYRPDTDAVGCIA